MKKTIATLSIIVVVVVLMAAISTFAFFSNRDAVTRIDLESENIISFTIGYNDAAQILQPQTAKADNSFTVEQDGAVARFVLTYSTSETSYPNMHIETTKLTYKQKDNSILPSDSVNAKYLDSVLQFGFANVADGVEANTVAPPANMHTIATLTKMSFNIGSIAAPKSGSVIMFVKLNALDEILPPMAKEIRVVMTVEASQI
ncbi:MAG: hypothetical protein RSB10_02860 [Clostridia bacterium]